MNNQTMEKIRLRYSGRKLSALRSIKLYCKEQCSAGDQESWKNCTFTACFLYPYRIGKGNRSKAPKPISTEQYPAKNTITGERRGSK